MIINFSWESSINANLKNDLLCWKMKQNNLQFFTIVQSDIITPQVNYIIRSMVKCYTREIRLFPSKLIIYQSFRRLIWLKMWSLCVSSHFGTDNRSLGRSCLESRFFRAFKGMVTEKVHNTLTDLASLKCLHQCTERNWEPHLENQIVCIFDIRFAFTAKEVSLLLSYYMLPKKIIKKST